MFKISGVQARLDLVWRQVGQRETATSSAEAARLEKELAQARAAAMSHGVGVKTRLQANQIAFVTYSLTHMRRCADDPEHPSFQVPRAD